MGPTDFQSLMTSSADEVLNSMFFVGVESNGDESAAAAEEWIAARMTFRGPLSGAFGIGAPLRTARTLAANFLGQDEAEIQDAQMQEVFCELSNMICGSFLSRLGNESVYDLSHPVCDDAASPAEEGVVCRWLQLDEGQLRVWLRMEPLP
ncbi:MAG: chemotaxis protein CheX [Acidobacteriaceae bacterium]